jgi:hypothetical protein
LRIAIWAKPVSMFPSSTGCCPLQRPSRSISVPISRSSSIHLEKNCRGTDPSNLSPVRVMLGRIERPRSEVGPMPSLVEHLKIGRSAPAPTAPVSVKKADAVSDAGAAQATPAWTARSGKNCQNHQNDRTEPRPPSRKSSPLLQERFHTTKTHSERSRAHRILALQFSFADLGVEFTTSICDCRESG